MMHHGLEGPPAMERGLRIADYCAIYPLIAGACAGAACVTPARTHSRASFRARHVHSNRLGVPVQQRRGMGHIGHAVVSDSRGHRLDGFGVRPLAKVRIAACGSALTISQTRAHAHALAQMAAVDHVHDDGLDRRAACHGHLFVRGRRGDRIAAAGRPRVHGAPGHAASFRARACSRVNAPTRGVGGCTRPSSRTRCLVALASTRSGTWPSSWARCPIIYSCGSM